MSEIRTGQCLCGKVRFRAEIETDFMACHCRQCQQWTGGGPLYSVNAKDVRVEGADLVRAYHASEWGERAVCGECGSTLYWKMRGRRISSLAVGLLDDQSGLRLTQEIFVDCRPEWLAPVEGASQSTEAEEMAKLDVFLKEQGNA